MTQEDLTRLAQVRQRDRDMYREGGNNLQMREDIHFLLKHLDEIIDSFQKAAS